MAKFKFIKTTFMFSFTILLFVLAFLLGALSFNKVWNSGLLNQIFVIIMLITIIIWLCIWVIFDLLESAEIEEEFGKFIGKPTGVIGILIGLFIPISFSFMIYFIGNISIFVTLMALVVLTTSIGDHIAIRKLFNLQKKDDTINPIIADYYLKNSHMLLHCIQLFLIACAGAAYLFIVPTLEPGNEWIVYCILTISIIINEYFINKWRWKRIKKESSSFNE